MKCVSMEKKWRRFHFDFQVALSFAALLEIPSSLGRLFARSFTISQKNAHKDRWVSTSSVATTSFRRAMSSSMRNFFIFCRVTDDGGAGVLDLGLPGGDEQDELEANMHASFLSFLFLFDKHQKNKKKYTVFLKSQGIPRHFNQN